MACGTPVVTSRLSSLPEVVGEAAILVDPYEVDDIAGALVRLLQDPALRARLSESGRARATQFSWDKSVRAVLSVYREVLGAGPAAPPAA
jgi:glycosyltransferase involved in cell wall biosynthesis